MRISSAASALPEHYYPQRVLVDAFKRHWGTRLDRFDVLQRLHAATKVDGRYLAFPLECYPFKTWGEANDRWIEATLALGEQAVRRAMEQAQIRPSEIAESFSSCTTVSAARSTKAR